MPTYPEIIENVREAVQKKMEEEEEGLKNEPVETEPQDFDQEKVEDGSLSSEPRDDEQEESGKGEKNEGGKYEWNLNYDIYICVSFIKIYIYFDFEHTA